MHLKCAIAARIVDALLDLERERWFTPIAERLSFVVCDACLDEHNRRASAFLDDVEWHAVDDSD